MKFLSSVALVAALVVPTLRGQGLIWTDRSAGGAPRTFTSAAYGAGRFVVLGTGNGSTAVSVSTNATTWASTPLPVPTVASGIVFGNGSFLVAGPVRNDPPFQGILRSPDGTNWTEVPIGAGRSPGIRGIAAVGGNYVVVGDGIYTSSDGVTWTQVGGGPNTPPLINVLANPALKNFVGWTADSTLWSSPTGAVWTRAATTGAPGGTVILCVGLTGDGYVAVITTGPNSTRLFSSADGTNWLAGPVLPTTPVPDSVGSTSSPGGVSFVATGIAADNNIGSGKARVVVSGYFPSYTRGTSVTPSAATIMTSTQDLSTWTTQQPAPNGGVDSGLGNIQSFVSFANALFLSGTSTAATSNPARTINGRFFSTSVGPVFSVQPTENLTIDAGGTAKFSVSAVGTPVVYQWHKDGIPLSGATGNTLELTDASPEDAGNYVAVATGPTGTNVSTPSSLTVIAPPFGYLSNLSVLARAGTGEQILTAGVTVGGGAGTKPVLIRGIGPTLSAFGVSDVLADPMLKVSRGNFAVASNDDWGNDASIITASSAVGAFPLPAIAKDSAVNVAGFSADGYVVELAGKNGATGTGLIEIYDAERGRVMTTKRIRLTNLSARVFGGVGANSLTVGFTIAGTGNARVLVRAGGPGLAPFGVSGLMPDPKLELYNAAGLKLQENDNWDASTLAIQNSVGAFPFPNGSKDAVLVTTLAPGGYTAQVVAVGGAAGIVLVEVYEIP